MRRVAQLGTATLLLGALAACDAPISDFPVVNAPSQDGGVSGGTTDEGVDSGDPPDARSVTVGSVTFTATVHGESVYLDVVHPSDAVVLYPRCTGAPELLVESGDASLPVNDHDGVPSDCPEADSCEAFSAQTPVASYASSTAARPAAGDQPSAAGGRVRVTFLFTTDPSCEGFERVTLDLDVPDDAGL